MMAPFLPTMLHADGIRQHSQVKFGGYMHTPGARDGDIYAMQNMTSDDYPLLGARGERYLLRTLERPNGIFYSDGLYWVDGTQFYADGAVKGTVSDSRKQFVAMGAYIILLPDMTYYNRITGEFGSLRASWSGAASITDGTYVGEAAEANTITAAGIGQAFRAGDAVTISGCVLHPENNKTAIIREIEGDSLRFSEHCFVIGGGGDSETVTIAREVPEMDFACANENRMWGCRGDTIYASKLGDPFNWNVFDGIANDSYAVDVGSAGDFTGCVAYLGYPCFFKEEHIYKVYGDRPSNYQVMGSASLGVRAGCHGSLAIAGEVLFYLSRIGVVAYSGGVPQSVAEAFGGERYADAVAGSDGVKYYISMRDGAGEVHLFVYDTSRGIWHREDGLEAVGFGMGGELHCLGADGRMWLIGRVREAPADTVREGAVEWMAEWADFIEESASKKHIAKLLLRMELGDGTEVRISMRFDGGEWEEIAVMAAEKKRSYYLPIIPRRCDHFALRLDGIGEFRLHSLVREIARGSEND